MLYFMPNGMEWRKISPQHSLIHNLWKRILVSIPQPKRINLAKPKLEMKTSVKVVFIPHHLFFSFAARWHHSSCSVCKEGCQRPTRHQSMVCLSIKGESYFTLLLGEKGEILKDHSMLLRTERCSFRLMPNNVSLRSNLL